MSTLVEWLVNSLLNDRQTYNIVSLNLVNLDGTQSNLININANLAFQECMVTFAREGGRKILWRARKYFGPVTRKASNTWVGGGAGPQCVWNFLSVESLIYTKISNFSRKVQIQKCLLWHAPYATNYLPQLRTGLMMLRKEFN